MSSLHRADVGDAGLRAQAGRGSALEMRSAFCLDGSKRMFYIFVADNDVNRAVIAHFDVRRATLKRAIINPTRIAPSTSTFVEAIGSYKYGRSYPYDVSEYRTLE
jgi:hypothetical protein